MPGNAVRPAPRTCPAWLCAADLASLPPRCVRLQRCWLQLPSASRPPSSGSQATRCARWRWHAGAPVLGTTMATAGAGGRNLRYLVPGSREYEYPPESHLPGEHAALSAASRRGMGVDPEAKVFPPRRSPCGQHTCFRELSEGGGRLRLPSRPPAGSKGERRRQGAVRGGGASGRIVIVRECGLTTANNEYGSSLIVG